nr:insulinase family protein [uncultured Bacillus sp.]
MRFKRNWKVSLFPTDKFSTVSIAVNFYNELENTVEFEENILFFYCMSALKKKLLAERFGYDAAERFVYSTSLYFHHQLKTYGTRIIHPRFSAHHENDLENVIAEIVNTSVHIKDLTEELFRKAKQEITAKIQRQFINPFAYSTARLLETIFDNRKYGTEMFGKLDIYQSLDASFLQKAEEYLQDLQQQDKRLYILGNIDADMLAFQSDDPLPYSQRKLVHKDVYEIEVRKDSIRQTILTFGFSCNDLQGFQDYLKIQLIDGMLGKYGHSKLFERLREKEMAAYHVITRYDMMCNILLVSVCVPCEAERRMKDEMIEHVLGFQIDSINLERAKQFFKNEVFYLLDTPEGTMSYLTILKTFSITLEDIERELANITCDDVSRFLSEKIAYIGVHVLRGE